MDVDALLGELLGADAAQLLQQTRRQEVASGELSPARSGGLAHVGMLSPVRTEVLKKKGKVFRVECEDEDEPSRAAEEPVTGSRKRKEKKRYTPAKAAASSRRPKAPVSELTSLLKQHAARDAEMERAAVLVHGRRMDAGELVSTMRDLRNADAAAALRESDEEDSDSEPDDDPVAKRFRGGETVSLTTARDDLLPGPIRGEFMGACVQLPGAMPMTLEALRGNARPGRGASRSDDGARAYDSAAHAAMDPAGLIRRMHEWSQRTNGALAAAGAATAVASVAVIAPSTPAMSSPESQSGWGALSSQRSGGSSLQRSVGGAPASSGGGHRSSIGLNLCASLHPSQMTHSSSSSSGSDRSGAFNAAADLPRFPGLLSTLPCALSTPLAALGGPIDVTQCVYPPPPSRLLTRYQDSELYSEKLAANARRNASPMRKRLQGLASSSSSSSRAGSPSRKPSGASGQPGAEEAARLFARLRRYDPGSVWAPIAPILADAVPKAVPSEAALPLPIAVLASSAALGCGSGYGTHVAQLPPYAETSRYEDQPTQPVGAPTDAEADGPPYVDVGTWLASVEALVRTRDEHQGSHADNLLAAALQAMTACTDAVCHSIGVHAVTLAPMPRRAVSRLRAVLSGRISAVDDGDSDEDGGEGDSDEENEFGDDSDSDDDGVVGNAVARTRSGGKTMPDRPVFLYHRSHLMSVARTALLLLADPLVAPGNADAGRDDVPFEVTPAASTIMITLPDVSRAVTHTRDASTSDHRLHVDAAVQLHRALTRVLCATSDVLHWRESVLEPAWHTAHRRAAGAGSGSQVGSDDEREEEDAARGGSSGGGGAVDRYAVTRAESESFAPFREHLDEDWCVELVEGVLQAALAPAFVGPAATSPAAAPSPSTGAAGASSSSASAFANVAVPSDPFVECADRPPPPIASAPTDLGTWLQAKRDGAIGAKIAVWSDRAKKPHWRTGVITSYFSAPKRVPGSDRPVKAGMFEFNTDGPHGGMTAYLRLSAVLVRPQTAAEMAASAKGALGAEEEADSALPFPHARCLETIVSGLAGALRRQGSGTHDSPIPRLYTAAMPRSECGPGVPESYHYVAGIASRSPLGFLARRLALISAHSLSLITGVSVPVRQASDVVMKREQRRMAAQLAILQRRNNMVRQATGQKPFPVAGAGGAATVKALTVAEKAKATAAAELASGKQRDIREAFFKSASSAAAPKGQDASAASSSSAAAVAPSMPSRSTSGARGIDMMLSPELKAGGDDDSGDGQDEDIGDGAGGVAYGDAGGDVDGGALGQALDAAADAMDEPEEEEDDGEGAELTGSASAFSPSAPSPWLPLVPASVLVELGQALPSSAGVDNSAAGKDKRGVCRPCTRVLTRPAGLASATFAVARIMGRVDPMPPAAPPEAEAPSAAALAAHWETMTLVVNLLRDVVVLMAAHAAPPAPLLPKGPASSAAAGATDGRDPLGVGVAPMRYSHLPVGWTLALSQGSAQGAGSAKSGNRGRASLANWTPSVPELAAMWEPTPMPPILHGKPDWHEKAFRKKAHAWEGAVDHDDLTLPARRFQEAAKALSGVLAAHAPPLVHRS